MIALAVVLVLSPVLAEDGDLRLVATGVGDDEVIWVLNGVEVARSHDREAVTVAVAAGVHDLQVHSNATTRWQAVARPDPQVEGAAYVPAWTAIHEPPAADEGGRTWLRPSIPLALGALAVLLLVAPGRRGLEVLRRRWSA